MFHLLYFLYPHLFNQRSVPYSLISMCHKTLHACVIYSCISFSSDLFKGLVPQNLFCESVFSQTFYDLFFYQSFFKYLIFHFISPYRQIVVHAVLLTFPLNNSLYDLHVSLFASLQVQIDNDLPFSPNLLPKQ